MARKPSFTRQLAQSKLFASMERAAARRLVLAEVAKFPKGITCADLSAVMGWGQNRLTGRLDELERVGLVKREGTAISSSTGHLGNVWMITEKTANAA